VNRELRDAEGVDVSPVVALLAITIGWLLIVPPFVSWYRTFQRLQQAQQRAGLTSEAVDLLVPHQANIRIIEATAHHAHIPMEKVFVNVDRYGNTSSASIPIALDEARRSGRLEPGMVVLLVTFGAGLTWGAAVLRW